MYLVIFLSFGFHKKKHRLFLGYCMDFWGFFLRFKEYLWAFGVYWSILGFWVVGVSSGVLGVLGVLIFKNF